ncbi:MAG: LysR family transcriptional regulator, partial [Clostridiales bacterium]|nr:LysR family transcriptional regulator [Clostridiales bacterium]
KSIRVSDRATLFNLLIGLNGYTVSTGMVSADLNGGNITAIPLNIDDGIRVGWIGHKAVRPTRQAELYIEELKAVVAEYIPD